MNLREKFLIEMDLTEKESTNMDIIEIKNWPVKKNMIKQ